jgi:hypothetical protein
MGLLSSIESTSGKKHSQPQKPINGLLAKADLLAKGSVNFQQWADKKHIAHAGLFMNINNMYMIVHAYGLDSITIAKSVSTLDFWKGTLPDMNKWMTYSASEKKIEGFYQLLSTELKGKVHQLSFFRSSNNNIILMIINTGEPVINMSEETLPSFIQENRTDFSSLTTAFRSGLGISHAQLFLACLKPAVETSYKSVKAVPDIFHAQITKTIFEQSFFYIKRTFQVPNSCCMGTNEEIKIILFSRSQLSEKVLQVHLAQLLKPVLGQPAETILLLPAGFCDRLKNIQDFLIQG